MLEYAVKCGYIQENPNAKIDKPKKAKADIPYYTPEEVEKLISVLQLEPIKYQAIILLALDLGCRRGELTGLTWEDIDFETGRVQINKTTQYAYGEIFEKGTKTANSERVNYISQTTIEILKKWQKEQLKQKLLLGSKWQGSKRVFTTDYGADIHPDTPTKILGKIIDKYGLKKITFHGLRHTNVTLMIAKGIQTQIISRKVGHSSVQTTDRVYSHFFEDEFKNVPNVMEEFLTVKAN
jgi:integrase